jgi:hypothetical protein
MIPDRAAISHGITVRTLLILLTQKLIGKVLSQSCQSQYGVSGGADGHNGRIANV